MKPLDQMAIRKSSSENFSGKISFKQFLHPRWQLSEKSLPEVSGCNVGSLELWFALDGRKVVSFFFDKYTGDGCNSRHDSIQNENRAIAVGFVIYQSTCVDQNPSS